MSKFDPEIRCIMMHASIAKTTCYKRQQSNLAAFKEPHPECTDCPKGKLVRDEIVRITREGKINIQRETADYYAKKIIGVVSPTEKKPPTEETPVKQKTPVCQKEQVQAGEIAPLLTTAEVLTQAGITKPQLAILISKKDVPGPVKFVGNTKNTARTVYYPRETMEQARAIVSTEGLIDTATILKRTGISSNQFGYLKTRKLVSGLVKHTGRRADKRTWYREEIIGEIEAALKINRKALRPAPSQVIAAPPQVVAQLQADVAWIKQKLMQDFE